MPFEDSHKFEEFQKIPRLSRTIIITEKLDGTNAQVFITEDGDVVAGSRNRYVSIGDDNYGFAGWVQGNKTELLKLGVGRHYGEWWGNGIQRNYGLKEKRFSLFNTGRWLDDAIRPSCCHVVPLLGIHDFDTIYIDGILEKLKIEGSKGAPGFMDPEGIVIYQKAANMLFKKTIHKDQEPKSLDSGK